MAGPKNTVLSDPTPYLPPQEKQATAQKPKASDWARLGKSRKYKQIDEYIQQREEFFRHFLPGGDSLAQLAIKDPALAGTWAAVASTIVDELEAFRYKVQLESGK